MIDFFFKLNKHGIFLNIKDAFNKKKPSASQGDLLRILVSPTQEISAWQRGCRFCFFS
jgi:hypothetical protein